MMKKATRGEQQKHCCCFTTICKSCNRAKGNRVQQQQLEPVNMSRIFEALQRSESERSGVATPPPQVATDPLRAGQRLAGRITPHDVSADELAPDGFAEQEFIEKDLV